MLITMLDSQSIVINKNFIEVNYLSIMRTCGKWKIDDWKGPVPHFFGGKEDLIVSFVEYIYRCCK